MEARVVYFDSRPKWQVAGERLRLALHRLGHADVPISWVRVDTEEEATAAGFAGSPAFVADGEDLFPSGAAWTRRLGLPPVLDIPRARLGSPMLRIWSRPSLREVDGS